VEFNRRVSRARVKCENWYGRLKVGWRCMSTKFRGERDVAYADYFFICAALTNYQCRLRPLRAEREAP